MIKKHFITVALVMMLIVTSATCTGLANNTRPTDGNGKIGFSTITLGSEFFAQLDDNVRRRMEEAGYELITISCEGSAAQQVTDIENLITMDCEAIFFFPIDPDAVVDVLRKAREQGIKVYGAACTFEDTEVYDKIINTDQYASGVAAAEMTAAWVEEIFPNAQDGSIEIALMINTSSIDSSKRSNGMATIEELSSKIKVVGSYDIAGASNSNVKAQEYSEMLQSQYPNLKAIISYGMDISLGCNEVYMRDAGLNRDEFGVFGVDTGEVLYKEIGKSITNGSMIRGTVSLGDDLSLDVWECLIDADLEYMDENRCIFKPVKKITKENITDYLK